MRPLPDPRSRKVKSSEVQIGIPRQIVEHLVETARVRSADMENETPQQSIAPAHGGAGRVDAIFPVVVGVAIALAQTRGSGIADELPERGHQWRVAANRPVREATSHH